MMARLLYYLHFHSIKTLHQEPNNVHDLTQNGEITQFGIREDDSRREAT